VESTVFASFSGAPCLSDVRALTLLLCLPSYDDAIYCLIPRDRSPLSLPPPSSPTLSSSPNFICYAQRSRDGLDGFGLALVLPSPPHLLATCLLCAWRIGISFPVTLSCGLRFRAYTLYRAMYLPLPLLLTSNTKSLRSSISAFLDCSYPSPSRSWSTRFERVRPFLFNPSSVCVVSMAGARRLTRMVDRDMRKHNATTVWLLLA